MSTQLPALRPEQVLAALNALGRAQRRPVAELYSLYALECVLDRLGRTRYRDDFVLKGGILLAAYRLRRPTGDIDLQAMDFALDVEHVRAVVEETASVQIDDGLVLSTNSLAVEQIRDEEEYTGLRVIVKEVTLHGRRLPAGIKLDISTGDPITPAPLTVRLPGLLGGFVEVSGHPLPTVIAEKTVTVLQRGTQSTRWRDYVDIRSLARRYTFTAGELLASGTATAAHRSVELGPLAAVTRAYGAIGQAKWSAWVAKNGMQDSAQANLDDQIADIVAFIDPVYTGAVTADATWNPNAYAWTERVPRA